MELGFFSKGKAFDAEMELATHQGKSNIWYRKRSFFIKSDSPISISLFCLPTCPQAVKQLEPNQRRDYEHARDIAATLVAQESPTLWFLQCEQYNVSRAACRLALYWKHRKEYFGERRWLLPMVQTGAGALNAQDIAMLRTGFMAIVEDTAATATAQTTTVNNGRPPVLLVDDARLPTTLGSTEIRLAYYFCHVLNQTHPQVRTHGLRVVYVVSSAPRPPVNLDYDGGQVLQHALPILNGMMQHVAIVEAHEMGRERLINSLTFQKRVEVEYRFTCRPTLVSEGQSVAGTLQLAQFHGIERAHLPSSMGGQYSYAHDFANWVKQRQSLENHVMTTIHTSPFPCFASTPRTPPLPSLMVPAAAAAAEAPSTTWSSNVVSCANTAPIILASAGNSKSIDQSPSPATLERLPNETQADFLKRRNAFYARRTYHQTKLTITSLEEQASVWQQRNDAIRAENDRLWHLLQHARAMASMLVPDPATSLSGDVVSSPF